MSCSYLAGDYTLANERYAAAIEALEPLTDQIAVEFEAAMRATLDWWDSMPEAADGPRTELRAGIAPEKEAAVLAAWHAR